MSKFIDFQIQRLKNTIKGQATTIRDDKQKSKEQKEAELKELQELYRYVSEFREIKKITMDLEDDYK